MCRRWILAALVSCLSMTGASCGEPSSAAGPGVSNDPKAGSVAEAAAESTVRTDREPIEKRFPGLGAFTAVHWLGGTVGDDRVPGPSLYFIEAVVQLAEPDTARLAAADGQVGTAAPQPPAPLLPFVPNAGGWTRSEQLEAGFAPSQWRAEVRLNRESGTVVISARGE